MGKNPTDRGKPGTKQSVLVEGDGGPLGVVIAGANAPDFKLLDETIRALVVERPDPAEVEQHLCLDAGYDNAPARSVVEGSGYIGHIRPAREGSGPKRRPGRRKNRRWVVERTLGWLSIGILLRTLIFWPRLRALTAVEPMFLNIREDLAIAKSSVVVEPEQDGLGRKTAPREK